MSLTKAALVAVVYSRLHSLAEQVPDVDVELQEVLHDISGRADFIVTSTTQSLSDGTSSYSVPTNCRNILHMWVSDRDYLIRIPYPQWRRQVENNSSPSEGDPDEYALHNESYYLYPVPDTTYTLNIQYSKYHDTDLATIELGDRFKGAIVEGVLAALWLGVLGRLENAVQQEARHTQRYERMIAELAGQYRSEPGQVQYNDL